MISLSDSTPGNTYTIKWMIGRPQILDVLRKLEIRENAVVEVLCQHQGGIIVKTAGKRIALDADTARMVKV